MFLQFKFELFLKWVKTRKLSNLNPFENRFVRIIQNCFIVSFIYIGYWYIVDKYTLKFICCYIVIVKIMSHYIKQTKNSVTLFLQVFIFLNFRNVGKVVFCVGVCLPSTIWTVCACVYHLMIKCVVWTYFGYI